MTEINVINFTKVIAKYCADTQLYGSDYVIMNTVWFDCMDKFPEFQRSFYI